MTNLLGTDLNAACSSSLEARSMEGPGTESSEHPCGFKYEGDKTSIKPANKARWGY